MAGAAFIYRMFIMWRESIAYIAGPLYHSSGFCWHLGRHRRSFCCPFGKGE